MKIIYCCYGGSHSSVTAAAIHLGLLPLNRKPTGAELLNIPYFDRQKNPDHGFFRFMGKDEYGNEVYIVGKHNLGKSFEDIIRQIAGIYGFDQSDLALIDTMPYVNVTMMIGGFTSRRLGIIWIGRPVVILGTKKAYFKLAAMVHRIKITIASGRIEHGGPDENHILQL